MLFVSFLTLITYIYVLHKSYQVTIHSFWMRLSCNLHFIMKMKCFMFSQFFALVFWPKSKICTTIRPLGSKATRLRDSVKSQHFFVVLFARLFSLALKKRTKWSLITIMIITAVRKNSTSISMQHVFCANIQLFCGWSKSTLHK